ncbi:MULTISPECIES: hypothetical protein [Bacillus]|uniref:hypothetical protein n=1 Tax=Bacillus TaxID=1386 RepID=UPI0015CF45C6|nr:MULTISPECIES: hypothetical protein [Bacillus]
MDIKKVAEVLQEQAYIFTCSYETAWKRWMHPAITESFTFEEVVTHINKRAASKS